MEISQEFDALKMLAATVPHLKQYFCDSQDDNPVSRDLEFIENYITLNDSPQLPEKVKSVFKIFTSEIYEDVKHLLSFHPHLRWSFCSSIFAISLSKGLTNIFSAQITLWSLQTCRGIADQNLETRAAICQGPGLFG